MIFPWQVAEWRVIEHMQQANRLPHALLLSGIAGVGKLHFANHIVRLLLCEQSPSTVVAQTNTACTCHTCRLLAGGVHPNVLLVKPEKAGSMIKIDQIREVSDFVSKSSLQGRERIVIIYAADQMNIHAANGLLKTLEEPLSGAILILIADQLEGLPMTIRSRCQTILFPCPAPVLALQWLKNQLTDAAIDFELLLSIANGAPLAALKLVKENILAVRQRWYTALSSLQDPIQTAAALQDEVLLNIVDLSVSFVIDLLRLQLGVDSARIVNKDFQKQLNAWQQKMDLNKSIQFMNYLQKTRKQISQGINLNKQLTIESILGRWHTGRDCYGASG